MKAEFSIRVQIDSNNVITSIDSKEIQDMDMSLFNSITKMFTDLKNRLQRQVALYYGQEALDKTAPGKDDAGMAALESPAAEEDGNEQ